MAREDLVEFKMREKMPFIKVLRFDEKNLEKAYEI